MARIKNKARADGRLQSIVYIGGGKYKYVYAATQKELAERVNELKVKAIPHNYRLTSFPSACLHFFRHTAQKLLERRQPSCVVFIQSDEKTDCAIERQ